MVSLDDETDGQRYRWAAFISYRHTPRARAIASSLEAAFRTYGHSRIRRPRRVFRDEQSLRPGDPIGPAIREALRQSKFLVYLAERESAASVWVKDELDFWCDELGRSNRLIIIHIADRLSFGAETKQIDWDATDALPVGLRGHLMPMPLVSHLAWIVSDTDRSLQHPRFLAEVNAIVARIEGVTPEDMSGAEISAHRKNRVMLMTAIGVIVGLAVLAVVLALVSRAQRNEALKVAHASQLELEALQMEPVDPTKALRIAQKAYDITPTRTNRRLLNKWHIDGSFYARELRGGGSANDVAWGEAGLFAGIGSRPVLLKEDWSQIQLAPNASAILHVGILARGTQLGVVAFGDEMKGTSTAVRWDLASGREIARFDFGDQVRTAAFSDEPPFLVAATLNHGVVGYDLTGKSPPRLILDEQAQAVAITSTGSTIAVAVGEEIRVFGGPTGSPEKTLHDGAKVMAFGADGSTLLTGIGEYATLTDLASGESITTVGTQLTKSPVAAVAVRRDGLRIAVGHDDGRIVVWDRDGNRLRTIAAHRSSVRSLAFSPDGAWLASSGDSSVRIWAASGLDEPEWIRPVGGSSPVCVFAEDGASLLVQGGGDRLEVWKLDGSRTGRSLDIPYVEHAALHADGTIVASDNQHLRSSNGAPPVFLSVAALASLPRPYLPTGTVLLTRNQLQIRDDRLTLLASTTVSDSPRALAVSPTGDRIAVGDGRGHIRIWTTDLRLVADVAAHTRSVDALAYSRTGRYLVAGSSDKTATVHDATGSTLATLVEARDRISVVGFTPDELHVLTFNYAMGDGTGLLWDWGAGFAIQRLEGDEARVTTGAVSPVAPLAFTCSGRGRMWSLRSTLEEFLHSARVRTFTDEELGHGGIDD